MSFLANLFGGARRAAERDLERRLDVLRGELRAARAAGHTGALADLPARLGALDLTEEDAALELEIVDGLLAVASMQEDAARGDPLPVVVTTHRALAGEACHFLAPAWRPDAPGDSGGKLLFTPRRLVYLGSPAATLSWAHVADVRDQDRDIVLRARPDRLLVFRCNSYSDTLRGVWLAQQLAATTSRRPVAAGSSPAVSSGA
jgi:hypothetical protein